MFKGHTTIKIHHNTISEQLTVSGNFGMFWNGHNISFSYSDFESSLNYVSEILNVDLFKFNVDQFDHSAIVKVEDHPDIVIQNHLSLKGCQEAFKPNGKYWSNKDQLVKMYYATKRIKQLYTISIRKKILSDHCISDIVNLIRFEKKYNHPAKTFKNSLLVEEILKPEFIETCNQDLFKTYINIMKTGIVSIPEKRRI